MARTPEYVTQPVTLTAATFALVECGVGACEIVDELVLPDEEGALSGNGIVDGGGSWLGGSRRSLPSNCQCSTAGEWGQW